MDWQNFLTDYSSELLAKQEYLDWAKVPLEAREAKWFGFGRASEETIRSAELRLNVTLPDDLKDFYRVTNGWMFCSTKIYDIVPVQSLSYLKDADPNLHSLLAGLVNPDSCDQDLLDFRYTDETKVLRSIALSTRGDAATLLFDPELNLPDNEPRFGTWAAWRPGMLWNSRKFEDFFRVERETMLNLDG
ncbi:MAG: SMI1/KNR4 family protein [Planctomycetota bacterium]